MTEPTRNSDPARLHPVFRHKTAELLEALSDESIPFRLFEGFRSLERQGYLYAQGRTRPGAIVTKGGLIFIGGGDLAFHAIDKATGRDLWSAPVRETTGTPMTYLARSGRQFVVVATGRGTDAALVAFAIGGKQPSAQAPHENQSH